MDFEWSVGTTPWSRPSKVVWSILGYLLSIGLISKLPLTAKKRVASFKPFEVLVSMHSLFLCLGSLAMFLGGVAAYVHEGRKGGTFDFLVCKEFADTSRGSIYFIGYLYYLSKYVELIDTVILAFKGKSLSVLHVFHHSVMPVMCWLWLEQRQSLQEIALLTNTGVHVIMYYYFFASAIGRPPKWKKLVTLCQIIQFVFSFTMGLVYVCVRLKRQKACSGEFSLCVNVGINAIFLTLFLQFYNKASNYDRRPRPHKKSA